ncbi:hypothetical protein C7377_1204 [Balneicella halophila]|uniref:DUF3078 family protein n=2 Tax=Balneicella halophila TaxID=1537566 RepID=A0A7L4UP25_BALHA|nr:hypothetical protein C7377_1204 [Balneicella halophila]
MKYFKIIVVFLLISLSTVSAQENVESQDSIRLQKAIDVLHEHSKNDSLRQALIILKENIELDRTGQALEILEEATKNDSLTAKRKLQIDSVLNTMKSDEWFTWFRELTRDSLQFSLYDVVGNQAKIWTNTPELQSIRFWLHKSPTDSLGFWVHSLPTKGIMLVPDFDVYQETQFTEFRSSLLIPIPIKENSERFKLVPFKEYEMILRPWDVGMITNIGFAQSYFENWVKGGENSIAAHSNIKVFANYKKNKIEWENYLRWKYGVMQSSDLEEFIRNEDQVELNSKYGLKASKYWYYSTQLNIKTQLFDGYNYKSDGEHKISDFLSPGYLSLALGMDYKPSKHFSLLLSPVSGRLIYMKDIEALDETVYGIEEGKHVLGELGPYFRLKWNDEIFKSVNIDTSLELFSNYFNKVKNVDLDWSTAIDMEINYFMSARLLFQMIYDDDIEIPIYKEVDGGREQIGTKQQLQFNENLSIGLVFRL